eukprot:Skav230797  [mRNA]  locus=scaffold312:158893:163833:+ [translate_table: standard]
MPGRWVGTVLVRVKRLYAPGEKGRFLLGDYVSASDKAYRDWAASKSGRPSTVDGSYHLCKGGPEHCQAGGKSDIIVHVGQWRTWKEEELLGGGPDTFSKEAKNLIQQYFKKHDLGQPVEEAEGIPWRALGRQGILKLGKPDDSAGSRGKTRDEPAKRDPPGEQEKSKREKLSSLQEQLKALKAELREDRKRAATSGGGVRKKGDEEKTEKPPSKKAKKGVTFDDGGLGKDPVESEPDWGDDDDDGDDSGSSGDSLSDDESSDESPVEKKKKDAKKARREGSKTGESKGKRKKRTGSKRSKKTRKKKKKKGRSGKLDRDKGPFGVGETQRLPRVGSEEESYEGSTDDSEQSFRKAPSGLTLHLRLQRYAQRFPGRLATRLLQKMERATRFEGAMKKFSGEGQVMVKACAVTYMLTILSPMLKDKWNLRSQREMRVLSEILDLLAAGRGSSAADVVAQRLKALEQSVQDSNSWRKAKFLELVPEESGMTDRGEEQMMQKEVELEEKFRWKGYTPRWEEEHYPPKGKDGKGTGKQKGKGKGKAKTPAQAAAETKPKETAPEEEVGELDEAPVPESPPAATYRGVIREWLAGDRKVEEIGNLIMSTLDVSGSYLRDFRKEMEKHAVARDRTGSCTEILPISLKAVEESTSWSPALGKWLGLICLVLNYHFCAGGRNKKFMQHGEAINKKQMEMIVTHLLPALRRLCGDEIRLPSMEVMEADLARKGHNYDGSSYVVMEEIDPDKVFACWPKKEEAAVAKLEDFLKGETREKVLAPMKSILPKEEWPTSLLRSYVRASDENWARVVTEGYKRGLFQACPADEIIKDKEGRPVLNGAGAVLKMKGDTPQQRFISIFCPLNAISEKIEGDEATLPYVGQVCLVQVPEESEVVIDSEDMSSAFNLFQMPEGWRGLFVYEKQVPARCLGLEGEQPTYVALRTVPMGWLSAVGVVQAAVRHLAFDIAKLPGSTEVRKWQEMPEGDRTLLYLDSVDQLRIVSKTALHLVEGQPSKEHDKFKAACEAHGLPTNAAKMLAGSLHGSLQGGELRSTEGVFSLNLDKMRFDVGACLLLLGKWEWSFAEVAGVVGRLVFASAFRSLLANLAEVFHLLKGEPLQKKPSQQCRDEILMMLALLPLAFTTLKAPIYQKLSATDASPTGGGSCLATQLKRAKGSPDPLVLHCVACRSDMSEEIGAGVDMECPMGCGGRVCTLACYLEHRDDCPCGRKPVPVFSERWSGRNYPLTKSMMAVGFDVAPPYDRQVSAEMDFFTDRGKEIWEGLDATDVEAEHHAPDCKTFSRARGKPFWIGNRRYNGPPALRSEQHVLGFPWLRGDAAARVRQGNRMATRSIKRCDELDENYKYFGLEHPYRSYMWYTKPAIALASKPGVRMAVFSNCCFGGRRQKWTAVLTNCEALYQALHKPDCPHDMDWYDYQPYFDEAGEIRYPTEEEAEYPEELCNAYAFAMRAALQSTGVWPDEETHRLNELSRELEKYGRFSDSLLKAKVAERIFHMERLLVSGNEEHAFASMLRSGHYRGTDIRFLVEHLGERAMCAPCEADSDC